MGSCLSRMVAELQRVVMPSMRVDWKRCFHYLEGTQTETRDLEGSCNAADTFLLRRSQCDHPLRGRCISDVTSTFPSAVLSLRSISLSFLPATLHACKKILSDGADHNPDLLQHVSGTQRT